MKRQHVFLAMAACAIAAAGAADDRSASFDPASWVNPFIGTANGGNTYPGATLPFGMVAFSPEEERSSDTPFAPLASGYDWQLTRLHGFSLTHISGAGCAGGGDIPIMPVTDEVSNTPRKAGSAYSTDFSHQQEHASPGFYAVQLNNGVGVELSATARTGVARLSFPTDRPARLLFRVSDSESGSEHATIKIDQTRYMVAGSVTSGGFCGADSHSYYTLYFVARIDQPFQTGGTWTEDDLQPGHTQAELAASHSQESPSSAPNGAMPAPPGANGGQAIQPVNGQRFPVPADGNGAMSAPPGANGGQAIQPMSAAPGSKPAPAGGDGPKPGSGGMRLPPGVVPHAIMIGGTGGARPMSLGGWLNFDSHKSSVVTLQIGVSYVSEAAARANLEAEQPRGSTFESVREAAHRTWNRGLSQIQIQGGTQEQRTTFYTALYHALLAPNLFSDVDGHYRGFDGQIHKVSPGQTAQYSNFSLWDVYRSQLQLVAWLDPLVGSDLAQSMFNQAEQSGGVWNRWTHLTGASDVMNGDPSAAAVASIAAFGGRHFDLAGAYASLLKAATVPTAADESAKGCPFACKGERPGLTEELKLHYIPVGAPSGGSAADTLEMATADFALSELARRAGDEANARALRERSGWWRNLYNSHATPNGGYIQPRNADGSWPSVDPSSVEGFVEGSAAQYVWMVPFDPRGLFEAMGGTAAAQTRLDHFFQGTDRSWAFRSAGPLYADLSNEPTIETPWLYDFAGQPSKTQALVRAALTQLWPATPSGIPGNDDLGEMSSWYVWAAMGLYPMYPGRAELVLGSPLFPEIAVHRPGGAVTIHAPQAAADAPYVAGLAVDGQRSSRPWLPASFAERGGVLDFELSATPDRNWGTAQADAPPSFGATP